MFFFAGIGILAVLFALVVSWVPPEKLAIKPPFLYISILVAGVVILGGLPLVIYVLRKPH